MKATVFVGKVPVEIEADEKKELWRRMGFFGGVPDVCAVCQDSLVPNTYITNSKDEYFGVICTGNNADGTLHSLNFHTYKEPPNDWYIETGEATNPEKWNSYNPKTKKSTIGSASVTDGVTDADIDRMAASILVNMKEEKHPEINTVLFRFNTFVVTYVYAPAKSVVCDCPRYVSNKDQSDYKCEHIRAVILDATNKKAASARGAQ